MHKITSSLLRIIALALLLTVFHGTLHAAGIRVAPAKSSVLPGEDLDVDIIAEGIPATGLTGVQFRLSVQAPQSPIVGVADLSQAGTSEISVASPLLISPATEYRSGIGDAFWSSRGANGILVMDNEPLVNGSALFTFAHTNGANLPVGNVSVARFKMRIGAQATAKQLNIGLSEVMLLDSGPAYQLDYINDATVTVSCTAKVPMLIGLGLTEAQAILSSANLVLGNVYELNNANGNNPPNVVLEQSVPAGSDANCGSPVNLAVNIPPVLTLNPVASPTTVRSQALGGTMTAGSSISVIADSTATIGEVTYPTATSWSCMVGNLASGNNVITVTANDSNGDKSVVSTNINYTAMSAAVTPSSVSADYQGSVALNVMNIPSSAGEILVEQYADVNGNGIIDSTDFLIRSFTVTDGAASANLNIQGDEDGAANGSLTTSLNYYLAGDLYHAPGNYVFRATHGSDAATVPFKVTPRLSGQGISGVVTDGTNPVPGALVRLLDKWQRNISFALADATGSYALSVKEPGDYYIVPVAYGLATPTTNMTPVNIAVGQNIVNSNLTLHAGAYHITGRVKDEASGIGISGVWVEARGSNYSGVAITDNNGSYDLLLPDGTYSVSASADVIGPTPFSKGYTVFVKQVLTVNLSADVGQQDIVLRKGTVFASGRVIDQAGQAVPGLAVQGRIEATVDSREPLSMGVTDGDGNYVLSLYDADNWNISLSDAFAQAGGYLGATIRDFSTTTGSLGGNDLAVHQITAWVLGTVKDSNGSLLSDVEVKLRNTDSSRVATVKTAADGNYRIGTYAGDWLVNALTVEKGLYPVAERSVTLAEGQSSTVDFIASAAPPSGSVIINNGDQYTNSPSVLLTLAVTNPGGVSQMCLSNTTDCTAWENYTTTKSWTLSPGDGAKTVYAWYKDSQGIANTIPYTASITLDQIAPVLTISAPVANSTVNTSSIVVDGTVDENVSVSVKVNNGSPLTASIAGNMYTASVNLYPGLNTILVTATDRAGNTSQSTTTTTCIPPMTTYYGAMDNRVVSVDTSTTPVTINYLSFIPGFIAQSLPWRGGEGAGKGMRLEWTVSGPDPANNNLWTYNYKLIRGFSLNKAFAVFDIETGNTFTRANIKSWNAVSAMDINGNTIPSGLGSITLNGPANFRCNHIFTSDSELTYLTALNKYNTCQISSDPGIEPVGTPDDGLASATPTEGRKNHPFYGLRWIFPGHGFNSYEACAWEVQLVTDKAPIWGKFYAWGDQTSLSPYWYANLISENIDNSVRLEFPPASTVDQNGNMLPDFNIYRGWILVPGN
jgi:hypothetical protein